MYDYRRDIQNIKGIYSDNGLTFQGISDDLMNALSTLLASPVQSEASFVQQKSYVTYTISALVLSNGGPATITLLESRNLLTAGGITGFRTWEAAMHMGNYLCANPSLIHDKSVLELGTGTGYLSILSARYMNASHVLATDGSEDVVSSLATNFYLNDLQDSSTIEGKELRWGHALVGSEHPEWNGGRSIDLVIASDVTYDLTWHPALVSTFGELFDLYPTAKILIASAVRNEKTYEMFVNRCQSNALSVEHIDYEMPKLEVQEGPFYSDLAPVKLCMITKL